MAGKITTNTVQLGDSATATQNAVLQTNVDGTFKLARGNAGATTQDILTVDASGNVNAPVALQQAGTAVSRMVLSTAQNTTSGTAIDFTGIPSWAKRITVIFNGVSTNGSNHKLIQIGSGSVTTSGYVSTAATVNASIVNSTGGVTSTAGFITYQPSAAETISGHCIITLVSGSTYVCAVNVGASTNASSFGGGNVTLSGVLDRVRITTVGGTDTFDAGSVNILYEG